MKYNEEFYEKQKRGSISSGYVIRKYSQDKYYYRAIQMNDKDSKLIKNPEYGNEFGDI